MEEKNKGVEPSTNDLTGSARPHTPGPWFYSGRPGGAGSYPQYDIGLGLWDAAIDALNGTVHGCRGEEYMQVGGVCSEADAHLIAAAPTMNEALAKIEELTKPGQELDVSAAIDLICDVWNIARAAIAAAEGQSNG